MATRTRAKPAAGAARIKRGIVVQIPPNRGSSRLSSLWITEEGAELVVGDFGDSEFNDPHRFKRAHVITALERVLGKRNDDYVPIDPADVPDDGPDGFATFNRDGEYITYTHTCGEERDLPRATARALLAALKEGR